MSKLQAVELWKCGGCGEIHDEEDGALECCRPSIHEVYGCPDCTMVHTEEADAIKCCAEAGLGLTRCPCCARDYTHVEINHYAIEVAGHCNTCCPFFSLDEQFRIEDLYCASCA